MTNETPNPASEPKTNGNGAHGDGVESEAPAPDAAKIADLEAKLKDEGNKYLYLYAEFENYKKRVVKERSDLIKYGWEKVARDLTEVLDNFDRAIAHMPEDVDTNLRKGIQMIADHYRSTLEKQGVAEIATKNVAFNPELHEAMGQEPSSSPAGSITQVLSKGYTLHGRLLRPAKVVVSTGVPAQ